jgi:rhodanese-related sulfurtransferase
MTFAQRLKETAGGLLAIALLGLAGVSGVHAEVVNIDNATLSQLLKDGVPIVDLRTAPEWKQTGVVERSQMLTLFDERGRADPEAWLQQVDQAVGAEKPVILICRTGNRTRAAARFMNQQTPARKIYNVTEGVVGWSKAGNPLVSQQQNLQHAGISCGPTC